MAGLAFPEDQTACRGIASGRLSETGSAALEAGGGALEAGGGALEAGGAGDCPVVAIGDGVLLAAMWS